jgi:microcystin degradation protein MlrC
MAPRIALLGFMLETNAFAPVADEAEFRQKHWLEGDDIVTDARSPRARAGPSSRVSSIASWR